MSLRDVYFGGSSVTLEAYAMLIGAKLGEGETREVFEYGHHPDYVIKVETHGKEVFSNVLEWEIWNYVHGMRGVARWFAPCIRISVNGTFLVQRKVTPIADERRLPRMVPSFFTDLKVANWGLLDGRVVCCDYANFRVLGGGISLRKRRARWWRWDGEKQVYLKRR